MINEMEQQRVAAELSDTDLNQVAGGADEPRHQVTQEEYERILAKKIAAAKAKT